MLTALLGRVPGARGAVFCDVEGESVAQVVRDSLLSEYEMKVFGAQIAALWLTAQTGARERGAGAVLELQAGCAKGSLLCRALPEGYYVVLLVGRGAPLAPAAFELRAAAAEMAREI
jgi:predicted regulator of Ras-like GTPase activity (Roadblock/LC7/MglB family)